VTQVRTWALPLSDPRPREAPRSAGAVGIAGDRPFRPTGRHRGEPTACLTVSEVAGERGGAWTLPSLPPPSGRRAAGPPVAPGGALRQGLPLHLARRVAGQPLHQADLVRVLVHRQPGGAGPVSGGVAAGGIGHAGPARAPVAARPPFGGGGAGLEAFGGPGQGPDRSAKVPGRVRRVPGESAGGAAAGTGRRNRRSAMGTVVVTDEQIREAVPMADAVAAVRQAFADLAAGAFEIPVRAALGGGAFLSMPVHHRPSG